jgi:type II secretory pathway pseudopilin PulG
VRKLRNSRGDTIVEVLIALAVMTTVIVGAYASANKSQNSSQASQERAEAIKVAESQIERIKGLLASGTDANSTFSGVFCIKDDNTLDSTIPNTSAFGSANLASDSFPYSSECQKDGRYNVAVRRPSATNYEFLVRWERLGGGRDQINMYYRAH